MQVHIYSIEKIFLIFIIYLIIEKYIKNSNME